MTSGHWLTQKEGREIRNVRTLSEMLSCIHLQDEYESDDSLT